MKAILYLKDIKEPFAEVSLSYGSDLPEAICYNKRYFIRTSIKGGYPITAYYHEGLVIEVTDKEIKRL